MKRTFAALAAMLLWAIAARAQEPVPPFTVSVESSGDAEGPGLPVEFMAPFAVKEFDKSKTGYLVARDGGQFVCQVAPIGEPIEGAPYRWAHVSALVPNRDETYCLAWGGNLIPGGLPVVSTNMGEEVTFDDGRTQAAFDPGRFTLLKRLSLNERPLVPEYVQGLVNPQQGLELTLLNRITREEHRMLPSGSIGFEVESTGPVAAACAYKGEFAGAGEAGAVPYECRVSLASNGVMSARVTLPNEAIDARAFEVKSIRVRVPLVLERAAAVSFGGASWSGQGGAHWSGTASLAAAADGSYEFIDADASATSGRGPASWADYSDGNAGLAVAWGEGTLPLRLAVDYSEDCIDIELRPRDTRDAIEATIYLYPHQGRAGERACAALSQAIRRPARAAVSAEYLKAAVGSRAGGQAVSAPQ